LKSYPFTWIKNRETDRVVEERLDRAMVNSFLEETFSNVKLMNLIASYFDHNPILLNSEPVEKEELKHTLFQMHSNNLLSLDGFNPGFFSKVLEFS